MTRLLFPQSAILDILERLLTTPFYCWKFAPFCERHSFLCIVAVCWWKNEAYTDWYYSILLLSLIINSVTFRGPYWFLLFLSLKFCYICYFCDICHGCFKLARKILVTFAIFAMFADISGPFLISSFPKSRILLNLLFLRFLRYLSRVF